MCQYMDRAWILVPSVLKAGRNSAARAYLLWVYWNIPITAVRRAVLYASLRQGSRVSCAAFGNLIFGVAQPLLPIATTSS
jgi:hypothetical protein